MFGRLSEASLSLDIGTMFVIASCVTTLLGIFLLFAWLQDRIHALAWWGAAYLIGGLSGALWCLGDLISPPLPSSFADVLLFIAVGMIWSAARLFHGREVQWGAMCLGAVIWLGANTMPSFAQAAAGRLVVSSLIVAIYTFLIAAELGRERRKSLIHRWPAMFVPMLHGAIFLFPVAIAGLSRDGAGPGLGSGWFAVFTIEVVLYVVGAAFIVLVLAKDRNVRFHKMAAVTDPLTELFNRRGFFEAAAAVAAKQKERQAPISVLVFDLDHFKSINDRFGHKMGDATLRLFATVASKTMRAGDIIGRLGGEEFVALVPGKLADAMAAADRVRRAFAAASAAPVINKVSATVSVGVASGSPGADIEMLIARADVALYRAKTNGRDRVEATDDAVGAGAPAKPGPRAIRRPILAVARPAA
jgi:diguanylate cyclase (GGDEF)-like protein